MDYQDVIINVAINASKNVYFRAYLQRNKKGTRPILFFYYYYFLLLLYKTYINRDV